MSGEFPQIPTAEVAEERRGMEKWVEFTKDMPEKAFAFEKHPFEATCDISAPRIGSASRAVSLFIREASFGLGIDWKSEDGQKPGFLNKPGFFA